MATDIYDWLMAGEAGRDPFDRHLLACAVAIACTDPMRPLAEGLGLSGESLAALVGLYFPHAPGLLAGICDGSAPASIEEPDLRQLLLDHRSSGLIEEEWLAHIIARRSLETNHLWQDLGLFSRADLSGMMARHFAPMKALNDRDMKWKKFFYRQLCGQEGIPICKSPVCDACEDFASCFSAEDGLSLLAQSARANAPSANR